MASSEAGAIWEGPIRVGHVGLLRKVESYPIPDAETCCVVFVVLRCVLLSVYIALSYNF